MVYSGRLRPAAPRIRTGASDFRPCGASYMVDILNMLPINSAPAPFLIAGQERQKARKTCCYFSSTNLRRCSWKGSLAQRNTEDDSNTRGKDRVQLSSLRVERKIVKNKKKKKKERKIRKRRKMLDVEEEADDLYVPLREGREEQEERRRLLKSEVPSTNNGEGSVGEVKPTPKLRSWEALLTCPQARALPQRRQSRADQISASSAIRAMQLKMEQATRELLRGCDGTKRSRLLTEGLRRRVP